MKKQNMHEQWRKMIQMQHPEKLLKFARQLDKKTLAAIYGTDVETYISLKRELEEQVEEAADQLLADSSFADKVKRLPFKAGEIVIGAGESTTDDLLSWFEILRHLLKKVRPHDDISIINEGISGNTSTQLLGRFGSIVAQRPNWIICMIGGNDVLRLGPESAKTQVSAVETAKNISEIRRLAAIGTESRFVWITPPLVNEERIAAFPPFRYGQLSWRNEDIHAVSDIIRDQSDLVIDTQKKFGMSASPEWMQIDGLHPSISGHKEIVIWLVEALTDNIDM